MKKNKLHIDIISGFILTSIIFVIISMKQPNENSNIVFMSLRFFTFENISPSEFWIEINPIVFIGFVVVFSILSFVLRKIINSKSNNK